MGRESGALRVQAVGSITFLLTDVQGSTKLWERHPHETSEAMARHEEIIAHAVQRNGGTVHRTKGEGDSVFATFTDPACGLAAAFQAQRDLHVEQWPTPQPVRVRMALHTGDAELRDGTFYGTVVNRTARLRAAAHGGQLLVSQATLSAIDLRLPADITVRDLGLRRLKDLTVPERIYQVEHPSLPSAFPPVQTLDERSHNLPVQPTPLVGRVEDVVRARARILHEGARLLTFTGPGGVGKTRLALQVAAEAVDAFEDGVYFVPLAGVTDVDLVPEAIAATLAIKGAESAGTLLRAHLARTQTLLVLDNFEHVVDAAPFVADLLTTCPRLSIMVTSREPLDVRAEHIYDVEPLPVPSPQDPATADALGGWPATELFVERLRAVHPKAAVDDDAARDITRICRGLDGLPLAIELAAARCRTSSVSAVADGLVSRLGLLTRGPRDLPDRQRALRSVIAWSHDLLTQREQVLLRRLSVFSGGWTLEAAVEVVDDDVEETLRSLASKSLIRFEAYLVPRYSMLETIREFASEELSANEEAADVEQRHGAWALKIARAAHAGALKGDDHAVVALDPEHDNLRRALEVHDQTQLALDLALALTVFWSVRGHWSEGRRFLDAALASGVATPSRSASLMDAAGQLAELQGDLEIARKLLERSLDIRRGLRNRGHIRQTLQRLAVAARQLGDAEAARSHLEEALNLARQDGDRVDEGIVLNTLGTLTYAMGDLDAAERWYEEALELLRESARRGITVSTMTNLATLYIRRGRLDDASPLFIEALAVAEEIGDRRMELSARFSLARIALMSDDHQTALDGYHRCLELASELGDRTSQVVVLQDLSNYSVDTGDPGSALRWRERCLAVQRRLGDRKGIAKSLGFMARNARAAGDERAVRFRSEAIEEAAGARARDVLDEILTVEREAHDRDGIAECLLALAELDLLEDRGAEAAVRLGEVSSIRPTVDAGLVARARELAGAEFDPSWEQGRNVSQ